MIGQLPPTPTWIVVALIAAGIGFALSGWLHHHHHREIKKLKQKL